jgi:hypothetical protein
LDVLAAIFTRSLYNDNALVRAIADNAHDSPLAMLTPQIEPHPLSTADPPRTLDAANARLDRGPTA